MRITIDRYTQQMPITIGIYKIILKLSILTNKSYNVLTSLSIVYPQTYSNTILNSLSNNNLPSLLDPSGAVSPTILLVLPFRINCSI